MIWELWRSILPFNSQCEFVVNDKGDSNVIQRFIKIQRSVRNQTHSLKMRQLKNPGKKHLPGRLQFLLFFSASRIQLVQQVFCLPSLHFCTPWLKSTVILLQSLIKLCPYMTSACQLLIIFRYGTSPTWVSLNSSPACSARRKKNHNLLYTGFLIRNFLWSPTSFYFARMNAKYDSALGRAVV